MGDVGSGKELAIKQQQRIAERKEETENEITKTKKKTEKEKRLAITVFTLHSFYNSIERSNIDNDIDMNTSETHNVLNTI